MQLQISSKVWNPLLRRHELAGKVFSAQTPTSAELREELAKVLGCDVKLVHVRGIYSIFGAQAARFEADVYESEEAAELIPKPRPKVEKKPKSEKK